MIKTKKVNIYPRDVINSVTPPVRVTIKNTTNASIDNNSLFLRSDGNYKGVKLGGMKFAKYGSYKIEYDYKIISPSNDFFFQIETPLGGASESIYSTITGSSGKIGHNELYANLKGYDDYYIHLFPRDLSGAISFDNINPAVADHINNELPAHIDAA